MNSASCFTAAAMNWRCRSRLVWRFLALCAVSAESVVWHLILHSAIRRCPGFPSGPASAVRERREEMGANERIFTLNRGAGNFPGRGREGDRGGDIRMLMMLDIA